ncbi:hypothetical protein AVEN_23478-1 [Araneus ventricosus]|uniref:MADF domain-containing protein n=1 Tax=Araneus ventricosus TaxID=182803 RepID=A0A4Y2E728_ARAVE|nr:hypothetical protein AVEN_23478-1 [Araneus ventricosus]
MRTCFPSTAPMLWGKFAVSSNPLSTDSHISFVGGGKELMKRWKNLRDAFSKAEKKTKEDKTSGSQASKKRKYIFNDELQFLKKYSKKERLLRVSSQKKRTRLKPIGLAKKLLRT